MYANTAAHVDLASALATPALAHSIATALHGMAKPLGCTAAASHPEKAQQPLTAPAMQGSAL